MIWPLVLEHPRWGLPDFGTDDWVYGTNRHICAGSSIIGAKPLRLRRQ